MAKTTSAARGLASRLAAGAAAFDVSGFGRMRVSGEDAVDLLDRLSTNDLSNLRQGTGAGTVLTTNKGRVIDFLRVLRRGDDDLLVLTSPGTQERVAEWIDFYTFAEDVSVEDVSDETMQFLAAGEGAADATRAAIPVAADLDGFLDHANDGETTAVRGGMGALDAWEVVVPRGARAPDFGLPTLSENERDALRIELGIPEYPNDLNDRRNPLEANLKPYISFNKGCYIGQEVVARLNAYDKVQRFLCRLDVDGGALASPSASVTDGEGKAIGEVTSAAAGAALAYIRKRGCEDGARVSIASADGGQPLSATLRDIRPPAYFE